MMKKLKIKIMDELKKHTVFNSSKGEATVKTSWFQKLTDKLSLVTDKLQYYTYKLKKAGVEVVELFKNE